jgi:hypothetical protein
MEKRLKEYSHPDYAYNVKEGVRPSCPARADISVQ